MCSLSSEIDLVSEEIVSLTDCIELYSVQRKVQ